MPPVFFSFRRGGSVVFRAERLPKVLAQRFRNNMKVDQTVKSSVVKLFLPAAAMVSPLHATPEWAQLCFEFLFLRFRAEVIASNQPESSTLLGFVLGLPQRRKFN
ncbi:hypothetical protein M8J75_015346 [Diaphorina citri]|nr:hypothetical protein M8J75_015346 [Diaphorina citri]KAI5734548.1 hypothetical protein M8J77_007804 [Diaphorina citri]